MTKSDDLILSAREVLAGEPGLQLAMAYGSVATGKMRKDSDVDIAVLYGQPLSLEQRMRLAQLLQDRLSRTVDLVDLFALHGVILKQVLCRGCLIVKKSPAAFAGLLIRMIDNQTDMMPYYHRTLKERLEKFAHG